MRALTEKETEDEIEWIIELLEQYEHNTVETVSKHIETTTKRLVILKLTNGDPYDIWLCTTANEARRRYIEKKKLAT